MLNWLLGKDERSPEYAAAMEQERLLRAKAELDRLKYEAIKAVEIQQRVRHDIEERLKQLRREEERSRHEFLRRMDQGRAARGEEPFDYLSDPAWGRWKRCLLHAQYSRKAVEELADKLWYEAGMPEDRDIFWDQAEKQLTQRVMGEKGYSGACMTDAELAKQTAIEQFIRRRKAANKHGIIDNSSIPAGMPMFFYCKWCGILVETLPEDYIFSPRHQCSQCKGLSEMNWLTLAKETADGQGVHLPSPRRYVAGEETQ